MVRVPRCWVSHSRGASGSSVPARAARFLCASPSSRGDARQIQRDGRLTEVDYLNGEIVRLAESLGTASLARPLLRGLAAAGYKVEVVGDLAAAESALSSGRWDAVLASRAFDGGEASSLTQRMRRAGRVMPVAAVGEQFSTAGPWRHTASASAGTCSFCCAVRWPDGRWQDAKHLGAPHPAEVTYSVCPTCTAEIEEAIAALRANRKPTTEVSGGFGLRGKWYTRHSPCILQPRGAQGP